jgi:phosphonoacetaldehyde dehydrogenase
MIIDGERIEGREKFAVVNPYTGEEVGEVGIAGDGDIYRALSLSYDTKKDMSVDQRIEILETAASKVLEQKEDLAKLITSESGLSLKDTLYEVDRVHNVLNAAAAVVEDIEVDRTREFVKGVNRHPELRVINEPLDLVLGITPFNHPMNQVAHKIAPAIAANTAIVIKPSEKTPLSALKLVDILNESSLPKNVVNVLTTNTPERFLDYALHTKMPQMVTFTGGYHVGKEIAAEIVHSGNETVKYIPELGGNSALTILEDANLEVAVGAALYAYKNSGQRCTSVKRILLHNSIADEFISKFVDATEKIIYGDPMSGRTDMGTVINESAAKLIERRVEAVLNHSKESIYGMEGEAKLLYGHKREGALYSPTIVDRVSSRFKLVTEETFGPVAPITRINHLEDAIRHINCGGYKLASGIITASAESADMLANAIKVGQFNWNSNPGYRTEQAPFGGFGHSGNGQKEGVILATEGMRRLRTFYKH